VPGSYPPGRLHGGGEALCGEAMQALSRAMSALASSPDLKRKNIFSGQALEVGKRPVGGIFRMRVERAWAGGELAGNNYFWGGKGAVVLRGRPRQP